MTWRGVGLCLMAGVLAAGGVLWALVVLVLVIGFAHGA